jgi:DNA-binding NarL/FixJ family response regulator
MKNLRIVVADDHELVRHGLVALLSARPGWEVCGEAEDGRTAVDRIRELKPDVAVIDLGMPLLNGLEATKQIVRENPQVSVLILTVTDAEQAVRGALDAGARGFILKSDSARDLVTAVQALQHGTTFFTARVADMVLSAYLDNARDPKKKDKSDSPLNPREREVLQLLAEGHSSKEVAILLGISPKTSETHRANIMRKLKIHSVVDLVLFAVRNGVIQISMDGASHTRAHRVA